MTYKSRSIKTSAPLTQADDPETHVLHHSHVSQQTVSLRQVHFPNSWVQASKKLNYTQILHSGSAELSHRLGSGGARKGRGERERVLTLCSARNLGLLLSYTEAEEISDNFLELEASLQVCLCHLPGEYAQVMKLSISNYYGSEDPNFTRP